MRASRQGFESFTAAHRNRPVTLERSATITVLFGSKAYRRVEEITVFKVIQDKVCDVGSCDASYLAVRRGCHELH